MFLFIAKRTYYVILLSVKVMIIEMKVPDYGFQPSDSTRASMHGSGTVYPANDREGHVIASFNGPPL
jgi:hypothetical protein